MRPMGSAVNHMIGRGDHAARFRTEDVCEIETLSQFACLTTVRSRCTLARMTPSSRARTTLLALPVTLLLAACGADQSTAPGSQLPRGSASLTAAGMFAALQGYDSLATPDVIARVWYEDPIPTSAPPFAGASGLVLTWRATTGTHPELMGMSIPLPYAFHPPQTFQITDLEYDTTLGAARVNGGLVSYTASGGTITITSASDSSLAGTLDVKFTRGPVGSNLRVSGAFNATRCSIVIDDHSNPCSPQQSY